MKHTIAILVQNESGALTRVSSMFSTRGFNIDSLSVAPTKDSMISRLTLVTDVSDDQMDQVDHSESSYCRFAFVEIPT